MIGQTISHYRITKKLGEGGMGVVFKAEDLELGVTRALKFLPDEASTDERSLTRLKREARAAAALEHANICPVHEIGHAGDRTFIVMSCLEGETLAARLAANGPLSIDEALKVAAEVGDALSCAHESGIVHRDIKPANIMLTDAGRAVVMDFGLATAADLTKMTRTGTTLGTAAYMSPEQARGESVDARADLWSLGVVLYECITGQVPFPGENLAAVIHGLQHNQPTSVSQLRPDVPTELELVIDRALAKDPDHRFESVRSFLSDLESLGAGMGVSEDTHQAGRRKPGNNRRLFQVAALVLVVVAAAVVWQFGFQRGQTIRSLAVLPIANLSGDAEQEYFADGMTEALITQLQQLATDQLRVIGRTSVMRYKETDLLLPEIAAELDVDAIVEASVIRTEDGVRIAAKLIRARPEERQLWADNFERQIKDILLLHDEIARAIATQIEIALAPSTAEAHQVDPEAYEEYLIGSHIVDSTGDISRALPHFERAMELDPDFAPAWTQAAHCTLMPVHYWPFPREPVAKARDLVEHAIELDPDDAEAWFVLGHILYEHEFEMAQANEAFQRALALNPSGGRDLLVYAFFASATGRLAEAADAALRAIATDPFDFLILHRSTLPLMTARRYDDVRSEIDRLIKLGEDLEPDSWLYHHYILEGEYEKAIEIDEREGPWGSLDERSPFSNEPLGATHLRSLAGLYSSAGQAERAREFANEWLSVVEPDSISQAAAAEIYAVQGDFDRAIACIDTAWARKDILVVRINDPRMSALGRLLADEPRFEERLRRFGLTR